MLNIRNRIFFLLGKINPWKFFFICSFFFIANQHYDYIAWKTLGNTPFNNDAATYYAYLPAQFIHHDLSFHFPNNYKLITAPNGNLVPGYTLGVALMEAPFFFIGHAVALLFHYQADGYSAPYIWSVYFGTLLYVFLGLWFLYRMLILMFRPVIAVGALFGVFYASNLFFYSVCQGQMSHAYSFLWFSIFMYAIFSLYLRRSARMIYLAALSAGFIALIRPPDVLVLVIPLLAGFPGVQGWKDWWIFLYKKKMAVLGAFVLFLLVIGTQLVFWKIRTGSFYVDVYPDQHFFFKDPKISYFLFSYRKGLFLYTPVMILAFAGFAFLFSKHRSLFWPVCLYTGVSIYVLSSWWDWSYSGSFGARAMIENYAVLIIPLAAFLEGFVACFKATWKKIVAYSLTAILLYAMAWLNLSMSVKYKDAIIHWSGMTKEAYWYMLKKEHFDENDRLIIQKIIREQDPKKQMQGFRDE